MSELGDSHHARTVPRPTVGFVGLGRMGAPLAANVARAGFPLVVWNRGEEKSRAFASSIRSTVASSPSELAARADIVVSMVSDGTALESIFLRDRSVLDGLEGGMVIDMSTIGPTFARHFARRLENRGVRFIEAPVSGSTAAASSAKLTILVGGREEDFAFARPLLQAMGDPILYLGPPGAASLAKLAVNNLIYGINQCAAEGLVLAERGGLDRETVYRVFLNSAAAAPVLHYREQAFLRPGEGEVSLALTLAAKDLRLITELAERLDSPMPQAELNLQVARQAIACGLGEEDLAIVAEHLRRADPWRPTATETLQ